ncbi:SDR family NAD(P)-dependent oxidoreductase [Bacillus testis]|uniref:SDR family NAD(P)-dependent oxidoreductase n=1 Tax=Bacillus testis TaxID=1622072 RepID=UPI00067ED7E0|nr:glucose 1-dehydrogenase [Bacillus testis]
MAGLMVGKAGLVTGAGSGIGRASAIAFAREGAQVMVSDINEESGVATVKMIEDAGGTAAFFPCNVAKEEEMAALIQAAADSFGKLDFAHNNAGIGSMTAPIAETETDDWDKCIQINLYGTYYALKHQVREMLKNGGGAIVNTASTAGLQGMPNLAAYSASKWGINGLTKTVALEYGQKGIRVNSICPGMTLTPAIEYWFSTAPEQAKAVEASLPSGKIATPEDQGNAAVFLCSDFAKQINGVTLPVDGGGVAGKLEK